MKFSVGDAVLLKRTGEEGHIVSFLSKVIIEVVVAGVHFPVYEDELDHPYLKWFTEKKKAPLRLSSQTEFLPERIKERKQRLAQGIYLSFMPVFIADSFEDIITHFKIFLLNETASSLFFTYEVRDSNGGLVFAHQANLHPFGNVYLHPQSLEEMNDQPRFHWKVVEALQTTKMESNKGVLRIRPAKLFEQINSLLSSNTPAFNYLLTDDAAPTLKVSAKIDPLGIKMACKETENILPVWKTQEVLDLHIEVLVDKPDELSPTAMLDIQLSALEYHLDMAIAFNQASMYIIHGVGKGVLRDEVHHMLSNKAGIKSFENNWNMRFGLGATEVIFS